MIIKRPPVRDRRITLKQRVEEGTQLDDPPRLGRSPPDPERELSSHRYALVEQPRLAEPGASLHHDHAAGPGPDLAQPPAYGREFLLTSAEGRTERDVHPLTILGTRPPRLVSPARVVTLTARGYAVPVRRPCRDLT